MTTARTPNVKQHEQLPPLASRFVDSASLPWTKTAYPGVEAKTLLVDRSSGLLTVLLKMAPNARLPDHEHVLIEQTYLLEGTLTCGEGTVTAGNFVWRPAGSRHEAWAGPEGNLSIAMFQLPNKFFQADGRELDFLGNDWSEAWGGAAKAHAAR
jgi:anti-sigma factor ChrR (cupin superfamily)